MTDLISFNSKSRPDGWGSGEVLFILNGNNQSRSSHRLRFVGKISGRCVVHEVYLRLIHAKHCIAQYSQEKNMFVQDDLGAALYKTWSRKQRRDEISRLVEGYRNGLPIGVLCKMAETIAGNRKLARKFLHELLTPEERQTAVANEAGGMLILVKEFLS
jgi:hypothetical protein